MEIWDLFSQTGLISKVCICHTAPQIQKLGCKTNNCPWFQDISINSTNNIAVFYRSAHVALWCDSRLLINCSKSSILTSAPVVSVWIRPLVFERYVRKSFFCICENMQISLAVLPQGWSEPFFFFATYTRQKKKSTIQIFPFFF